MTLVMFFIVPNMVTLGIHYFGKRARLPKEIYKLTMQQRNNEEALPEVRNKKELEARNEFRRMVTLSVAGS